MAEPVSEVAAEFGRRVRALRSEQGYSQESFAAACDIDRSYMGQIERGEKNVTLHTMLRLGGVLRVDLSELVAGLASKGASRTEFSEDDTVSRR